MITLIEYEDKAKEKHEKEFSTLARLVKALRAVSTPTKAIYDLQKRGSAVFKFRGRKRHLEIKRDE